MKKYSMLLLLYVGIIFTISAQKFYFDIGPGLGLGMTKIDGNNVADQFEPFGKIDQDIFSVGLGAGYKYFNHIPLFFIGEIVMVNNDLDGDNNNPVFGTFISTLIGPRVVYYPVPLVQLGVSFGYSLAYGGSSGLNNYGIDDYNHFGSGIAWNISSAVDLGRGRHGWLIGLKYFHSITTLGQSNMFGIFTKYAFRNKQKSVLSIKYVY